MATYAARLRKVNDGNIYAAVGASNEIQVQKQDSTILTSVGQVNIGSTTVAADVLAIPTTKAVVVKTTGADAEALTLANGYEGQVLTIVLGTAGGGTGTLTPTTATTFATIAFATAGDSASLMYVDDTVGWIILGVWGAATQTAAPAVALS